MSNENKRGATERTPSHSQYFSWINNTNEGSTETQTLLNLDYFRYLHDTYGMNLDIYAWDAGNLDGASGTYEKLSGKKLSAQYPRGYAPIVDAAAGIGTRMGVWCGPDGFGDGYNEDEIRARKELFVSLCRDHNFALFKMDAVCGGLREEMRPHFAEMMEQCRKYCPDLVFLNHRLELGECEQYATTFLWEGTETYVDVHICNYCTAPNHRAFVFFRGNVPGLRRLTEDHGVCLSSCLDGFENDLIYQAFGRNLILAPEIYGNPWLLRDDEQGHLAHIYNLHRRLNDILVDGELWGEYDYILRGNEKTKILVFGNGSWKTQSVTLNTAGFGLDKADKIAVISHHPFEKFIGTYDYGDSFTVSIEPFSACLLEICHEDAAPEMPRDYEYIVLREDENCRPLKVKKITRRLPVPKHLGTAENCEIPENAKQLVEATLFRASSDSLEAQSLRRSGDTAIPEVKAARDAFFGQIRYRLRGCEGRFAFDGKDNTYFDGFSKNSDYGIMRVDGGCLRVDFGGIFDADSVEFEYFDTDSENIDLYYQCVPKSCEFSSDLNDWKETGEADSKVMFREEIDVVRHRVHDMYRATGNRCVTAYPVNGKIRYLRMPEPPDRIYRISLIKDGRRIELDSPTVNNLLPPPGYLVPAAAQKFRFVISKEDYEEYTDGAYIAVGLDGIIGKERAYAALSVDGSPLGAADRAPSFPVNAWECPSRITDRHHTFYFPVTEDMCGKDITAYIILCDSENTTPVTDVYLCAPCREPDGEIMVLE